MRRLAVWVFVILNSLSFVPSAEPRFGGTFIGAVICDDGIVVASDSRSTFVDSAGKQFGYVDGMPKIFAGKTSAFAVSGLTSVKGELFGSFVRRNDFLLARPVDEMLFGIALYLPFQNSTNVLLLSAGFVQGRPTICAKSPTDAQVCRNSGFITNKMSENLRRWQAGLGGTAPNKDSATAAMRRAISEFAEADLTIGGPSTVLYLPRSGAPQWIEARAPDTAWTTVCEIARDYRQGRIQIGFTKSRDELDRYLAATCPSSLSPSTNPQ